MDIEYFLEVILCIFFFFFNFVQLILSVSEDLT